MNQQIAISIVSNSRLLSEGLVALLSRRMYVQLIATYSGEPIQVHPPPSPQGHVVLLDSSIGRTTAQNWIFFWRQCTPPAAVVLLELIDDVELILACIEAGASGYTLRGAAPEEVADTIWMVSQGYARCSPQITAQLFDRLAQLKAQVAAEYVTTTPLTTRELEVLQLVAQGCSNKEIADKLYITLRTVKQHVHNILHKLELKHRYEAANLAREQGWVHPDRAQL